MQGSRLFKIVYFLLEKGRCTAPAGFSLNAQVKAEKLVSVQNAPPQKQAQNDFALFGGVKLAADRIGRKNRVIEKAAGTPEAGVYPCCFYCK